MTDAQDERGHKLGLWKQEGESDLAFRKRVQGALDNRPIEVAVRDIERAIHFSHTTLLIKLREAIEAERDEHESDMQDLLYQAMGDDL